MKRFPRRGKFNNKKTEVDGIVFDSKRESARYQELKLMERAGEVKDIELQKPFKIEVNGQKICTYKADFVYWMKVGKGKWKEVVEDVKSKATSILPIYRLKKKLVKAVFGVEIQEVY